MKNTNATSPHDDSNVKGVDKSILDKDIGEGLTDDERTQREDQKEEKGGRVDLGPADLERLPKK
ncbi:hypothetical protein [Pseudomonas sp. dw_358]|uniref:hypothetical protein n=1 Tax=Pseudomonas sp. dw_358 TaxID=2720083 RepID=UPI001BD22C75|nr:hypothetical protein [Pseudomonas sp. dw_358]